MAAPAILMRNPAMGLASPNMSRALAAVALPRGNYKPLEDHMLQQKDNFVYDLTADPELLEHPLFKMGNMLLGSRPGNRPEHKLANYLQNRIFNQNSKLFLIKQAEAGASVDASTRERFYDISTWGIRGAVPSLADHKLLFSVQELLLIRAVNELYNPLFKRGAVAGARSSLDIIRVLEGWRNQKATINRVRAENPPPKSAGLFGMFASAVGMGPKGPTDVAIERLKTESGLDILGSTALGPSVLNEINSVIGLVRTRGDSLFADPTLFNYYERIPVGAHLMYDFIAAKIHVFHHGIYIGNKAVIEILNYRDREGRIQSYQSITHINDFIKRAVINSSPIVIRLYNNPIPPDIIVERAVWSLGKFPRYNLYDENCETVASWICMNDYTQSHLCITPKTVFQPFIRAAAAAAAGEDDEELLAALALSNELERSSAALVRANSLDGGVRKYKKNKTTKNKANRRNKTRGRR